MGRQATVTHPSGLRSQADCHPDREGHGSIGPRRPGFHWKSRAAPFGSDWKRLPNQFKFFERAVQRVIGREPFAAPEADHLSGRTASSVLKQLRRASSVIGTSDPNDDRKTAFEAVAKKGPARNNAREDVDPSERCAASMRGTLPMPELKKRAGDRSPASCASAVDQPTLDFNMSRSSMCSLIWPRASLVTLRCSPF